MRWLTNLYDSRFKWTATAGIRIHPTKAWLSPLCEFQKIQSGRGDTLEERYAINFCFKLRKNVTETYEMVFDYLAWIEYQFLSGIRDSRMAGSLCGRIKEVRTPELIGQIKYFMDKDRRVSVEAISAQFDVSVWNCTHNYSRGTEDAEDLREVSPRGAQRRSERKTLSWQQGDGRADNSDPAVLDALVTCDESWIYSYEPETKRQSSQWKHAGSSRPKKARQSKSTHKPLMIPFFDSTGMIYMHWVPTGQTVNEEYYVEILREFRKRFRRKRTALFKSGRWHFPPRTMHQSTTPSLSQTIWPSWASRQFLSLPIVQTLLPVTFGYFLSSQAVVMRQLRRWKRAVTKVIDHAHTRQLPWGLREVLVTVQVHFSRRRLLRRELEFHVFTINKSAHTKKVLVTKNTVFHSLSSTL